MKLLRMIFGIVFIVVVVYGCIVVVPPYFAHYKFDDFVAEEARMSTYSSRSENDIRDSVFRKAQDLEIPVTREQINVQREGQAVNIWVDYRVHLDIPAYPVDLNFHTGSKNKAY
jgi:hypothetical protein